MKNLTLIWGSYSHPMVVSGLSDADAQELAEDLRSRGLTFSVVEEEMVGA